MEKIKALDIGKFTQICLDIEKDQDKQENFGNALFVGELRKFISSFPSIDAVPVKYGKWIEEKPDSYTCTTKCSVCGKSAPFICKSDDYYGVHMYGETEKTPYCPWCGAKMDLEEQDAAD